MPGETAADRPTIGDALRAAAAAHPDRPFLVTPTDRLTFAEAEAASRLLAGHLLAEGVGKGTRVGLFFTYGTEWLVAWLAASRIGALVMPFSTTYRPPELRTVLRIGDVALLLAPSEVLGRDVPALLEDTVPGLAGTAGTELRVPALPYLRRIWLTGPARPPWARPVDLAEPGPSVPPEVVAAAEAEVVPADPAVVVYTSGSSAEPKGVVHTQATVIRGTSDLAVRLVDTAPPGFRPVIFCAMPFFWVGGILCLGAALQSAATVLCQPRFEPAEALDLIEREGATLVMAWPNVISTLRDHPSFAGRDLRSAPALTDGPADLALVGTPVPGVPAHRGMSETMGQHGGVEERAVAAGTTDALPDMAEGELWVRGPNVMAGYYKRERHEVFDDDGWLHTGDRVFRHEGRAYFVGRHTELIKSGGGNVSPREVELALETFPEVLHAFVVGLPHPTRGEEVAAVLVAAEGATVDTAELGTRAREVLSPFKVPTTMVVWPLDAIPWLPSHKPDKRAIAARLAR